MVREVENRNHRLKEGTIHLKSDECVAKVLKDIEHNCPIPGSGVRRWAPFSCGGVMPCDGRCAGEG